MNIKITPRATFYFVLSFILVGNFVAAWQFNLSGDAAHYALYGRHLAWSYVDHPPLIGWLLALSQRVIGTFDMAIRLPAVCLSLLSLWWMYRLAYTLQSDPGFAYFSVLGMFWSVVFAVLMIMPMPQCVLVCAALASCYFALRIGDFNNTSDYLGLAIALGLAGLSDYTSIMLALGLLLYLVCYRRDLFASYKLYLAIFFALIIASPVLVWNVTHHYVSFNGTLHRGFGRHWQFRRFYQSLLMQIVAYSPGLVVFGFLGVKHAIKTKNRRWMLLVCAAMPTLLLYFYSGGYVRILFHWPLMGWMLLVPLAVCYIREHWFSRGVRVGAIASIVYIALVYLVLYSQVFFHWAHFPLGRAPLRDLYGWKVAASQARKDWQQIAKQDPNAVLFVNNWSLASRLAWYSGLPVQVTRPSEINGYYQFKQWFGLPGANSDGILVVPHAWHHPAKEGGRVGDFAHCTWMQTVPIQLDGKPYNDFSFYHCWGILQAPLKHNLSLV